MDIWNCVQKHSDLPMYARHATSSTLADWHSEIGIKRAFGKIWISHCGAAYDLRKFRGVARSSVLAVYYTPRRDGEQNKAIMIVFKGVSYQIHPMQIPGQTFFRTEADLKARNLALPL